MKQFIGLVTSLTLAALVVGCSSAHKKNSKEVVQAVSNQSEVTSEEMVKKNAKIAINKAEVTPEGAKFAPNAFDSEGNVQGYRCVALLEENTNPLSKAGIQLNDIVIAVNDRDLQSPKEASYFFELVRMNLYHSIKIQRGQRIFTVKKVSFTDEG